jgi:hypothetical protein
VSDGFDSLLPAFASWAYVSTSALTGRGTDPLLKKILKVRENFYRGPLGGSGTTAQGGTDGDPKSRRSGLMWHFPVGLLVAVVWWSVPL